MRPDPARGGAVPAVPRDPASSASRVLRRAVTATAGALGALALLVTVALPASAVPAIQPVAERGQVLAMGLKLVDAAALRCPTGVTTWTPMVLPIEMPIPQGEPNGTIDPLDIRNMPDNSPLWYRTLASTRSGVSMILDKEWTQDGLRAIPVTKTRLRSGTYLMGALCARPGPANRHTYPLDARGNLIGEWYVLTFRWVDSQPERSTFHFERQESTPGSDPTATADATPTATADATPTTATPTQTATAEASAQEESDGTDWGWLVIVPVLGLALLLGIRLRRNRRGPT